MSLLYSEKKPGDLSSRQVIIELILGIFELNYNPRVISQIDWKALIDLNKANTKSFSNPQDNSPAPLLSSSTNLSQPKRVAGSYDDGGKDGLLNLRLIRHEFVKKLLVGPPDLKKEQMVEFAVKTHRNRIFKSLVNKLIGVLMDYFWVFCHSENKFLDLSDIDKEKFEAPKVPSGMTGGVEYEAMYYCKPKPQSQTLPGAIPQVTGAPGLRSTPGVPAPPPPPPPPPLPAPAASSRPLFNSSTSLALRPMPPPPPSRAPVQPNVKQHVAIGAFETEEEGEIGLSKGNVVEVIQEEKNGWWLIKNSNKQGWVPSNYLQLVE
ncbi:hypothetical protein BY996DRAFT_1421019 [Phakopsora pachyrhizi]|nr:hypothetical protein BY996DRAFT_1421019 [Phakopsora pachyrhizi]